MDAYQRRGGATIRKPSKDSGCAGQSSWTRRIFRDRIDKEEWGVTNEGGKGSHGVNEPRIWGGS